MIIFHKKYVQSIKDCIYELLQRIFRKQVQTRESQIDPQNLLKDKVFDLNMISSDKLLLMMIFNLFQQKSSFQLINLKMSENGRSDLLSFINFSFVCFNTSAVSSWGQHYDSAQYSVLCFRGKRYQLFVFQYFSCLQLGLAQDSAQYSVQYSGGKRC